MFSKWVHSSLQMRFHDVWRKSSFWKSIQNHDRLIDSIVSFRTFAFLTIIQQKSKFVQMNDASQLRHIDFHLKRVDHHENVKLRLNDETSQNNFFVFDFIEIRFTFDEFRSKFAIFDSIAIHHHFFVRQQIVAMCLNHDQQLFFCIWVVMIRVLHVRYRMLNRVMKFLNNQISFRFIHIRFRNRISFTNDKMTINIIIDDLMMFNCFSSRRRNRKSNWLFNTTWHSSITMRFNRSWFWNR